MSFVFYVFLLFIDEIQLGVCQTAVLDIAVFSTVFRIVSLYRCRYVWIIRSGLGAFARHTVRIIRKYVQIRQQFCVDLFYDLLCQHTVRLIFYIRLVHNRVNNSFRVFYRCKSYKGNEIFSIASRILLCSTCFSSHRVTGNLCTLAASIGHDSLEETSHFIADFRAESRTKTTEKNTYQAEKDGLHEALLASETEKSEKEAALSECQEQIQAVELLSEQDKSEVIGLLNQRGSTKGKMQRYDAMLEQIGIRKAELSQRVLHLKTSESEQNGQMEELQNAFEALEETVSSLKQQYQEADQKITALTADLSNQTKEMEAGQTNYHREASRLESLKNITERYDGYGNSIRKVMEQKERNPGIHGVVADLLQAEKKYETAIETALGGSIQNIVTDNEATAMNLLGNRRKKNQKQW